MELVAEERKKTEEGPRARMREATPEEKEGRLDIKGKRLVLGPFTSLFLLPGLTLRGSFWNPPPFLKCGVAPPQVAAPTGKLCTRPNRSTWGKEIRYNGNGGKGALGW